ncbi:cytochrome c oxidase subunit II [Microbulbifer elongatus]|uniref:cytochrome c oxidase subunit II n=1 Tax=Microbulbifer elongatus TaxID=86173 RepID=UPI001E51893B|nr:hypothetical protein [Microbulbifer elongatus]
MLDPVGPAATEINTLWWIMLAGSALIAIIVAALIWRSFYSTPNPDKPRSRTLRIWIHGLGLAFPISVLAALLIYALVVGERLLPHHDTQVVRVHAIAQQWRWQFTYAERPNYVSEGILHIPAGRPVDVAITTRDVIHSFWVPRLAGKLDAIPGHVNTLRIEADAPGLYHGQSAEFSGAGYTGHTFVVQAHSAADWARFLAGESM